MQCCGVCCVLVPSLVRHLSHSQLTCLGWSEHSEVCLESLEKLLLIILGRRRKSFQGSVWHTVEVGTSGLELVAARE